MSYGYGIMLHCKFKVEASSRSAIGGVGLKALSRYQMDAPLPEWLENPNRLGAFARHLTFLPLAARSDALG